MIRTCGAVGAVVTTYASPGLCVSIHQAANSPAALQTILWGACISVPAIAGYTVFSYRVFRGKTGELKYA